MTNSGLDLTGVDGDGGRVMEDESGEDLMEVFGVDQTSLLAGVAGIGLEAGVGGRIDAVEGCSPSRPELVSIMGASSSD